MVHLSASATMALPDRSGSESPWRHRLVTVATVAACVVLGLGLGLLATARATRFSTVGAVSIGPWRVLGDAGSPAINPYLHAHMARTGQVPMATAQGLMALARADSAGAPLDARKCYRVHGPMPQAFFWTLGATDTQGASLTNPAGRLTFTAADVLRDITGDFSIALSRTAAPGNWLPLGGPARFLVILRLYDTPLSGPAARNLRNAALPAIHATPCA